ncbi:MAG: Uma2 family endonuclease [Myxococcales bacterium]|nr:Uma2 family endonuclease [Myxococcales bacterium]
MQNTQPTLTFELPELPVRLTPLVPLSDDGLFELCARNPTLRIERSADGDLLIMPPTGGETGRRNADLITDVNLWARTDGTGRVFDSSTGFVLPNGAERSPDVAWVLEARWGALTEAQRRRFVPLCPDFVIELRSPSDRLEALHDKMREYIANGLRLGWLIDPADRLVWVYRPGGVVERHEAPTTLSGGDVLVAFELATARLW